MGGLCFTYFSHIFEISKAENRTFATNGTVVQPIVVKLTIINSGKDRRERRGKKVTDTSVLKQVVVKPKETIIPRSTEQGVFMPKVANSTARPEVVAPQAGLIPSSYHVWVSKIVKRFVKAYDDNLSIM